MGSLTLKGVDQVSLDVDHGQVTIEFDRGLYPLDAVYGAAYIFIDRAYVFLDAPSDSRIKVQLSAHAEADEEALTELAGEFANELLAQAWRSQIAEANKPIIEAVAAQALAGSAGPQSLDDLDDMDFDGESFEDPLGIAMSWEEKYGKEPSGTIKEGESKGPPPVDRKEDDEKVAGG